MSTTQPIRSKQLLHDFKEYFLTKQPNSRNYTLILIGLNTALRINDILHLTWGDVYCTEHSRFYTHLLITEPTQTISFPVPEKLIPRSPDTRPTALSARLPRP